MSALEFTAPTVVVGPTGVPPAAPSPGPEPVPPELANALTGELQALTALLDVSRRELAAMGAWRLSALAEVLAEKSIAINHVEAATARRVAALEALSLASLSEAAERHSTLAPTRQQLLDTIDQLRDLSRLALEQAGRRLKWVATRRRALSGATVSGGGGTYGPRGDAPRLADGIGLNGRA